MVSWGSWHLGVQRLGLPSGQAWPYLGRGYGHWRPYFRHLENEGVGLASSQSQQSSQLQTLFRLVASSSHPLTLLSARVKF